MVISRDLDNSSSTKIRIIYNDLDLWVHWFNDQIDRLTASSWRDYLILRL